MNLDQFLADLADQGIVVQAAGDRLQVQTQNGPPSPDIQELLEDFEEEILLWLASRADDSAMLPQITPDPAARHEPFPLTDIQHAYWVGRSGAFALGDVSTHIYIELACGDLDLDRLNRAWQRLIERHDMLRAIITPGGQQQILAEAPAYQIAATDLRGQPQATIDEHIEAIRTELSHQVLPADQWPLFDLRATRLDGAQTRLHISLDVLFCDFGSLLKLFDAWRTLYHDPETATPLPALSFRDYVLAEKAIEETALYRQARTYWLDRLDALPPAPELPLAQDASALSRTRFERRSARLDQKQWDILKERAGQQGLTPNGILLAAFAEVLTTWSKSPRFTLNLTLFNRLPLHPDVAELIGDFTTLNLLAVDNSTPAPFVERAKQIQQQLWQDLDHRAFNGIRVLRELTRRGAREAGSVQAPIVFTSGLGLDSATGFQPFGQEVYSCSQTPQVWLDHVVIEEAGALNFSWNTVDDLFPPGLVDDMLAAYCDLLARLAEDAQLWQVLHPVQLPAAQQEQRRAANATDAPIAGELLHTLFLQQVEAHADDPAVIAPTRTLTYGELYAHANTVGHWLRERGARPNTLVAVVMEKDWEQAGAVLGIHLAGAAYLPIDPALPAERRHYLLSQGDVTLALTQSWLDAKLDWPAGIERLCVDTQPVNADLPALEIVQQPTDLAYVIYTSGSTGLPKGVIIDHRGAVNTVLDINRRFAVTEKDRVLALSALNFDLSVYDIFGLLAVGGAVVMPAPELRTDPAHWIELMVRHKVTLWDTVPALMQMLCNYLAGQKLATPLRVVMLSGDWIPLTLPDQIKALWDDVEVYSLGGATEASIWSIFYPIETIDPSWASIPYGKPLANQSFHVLDEQLNPRPVWVPGNLYIGGIGLALGYWKDSGKTNASFITHPHTGQRLYKTGDLGRYFPDGNIEFLGREDFQVKIGGHRIELGEIEANLLQHPDVKEVVVNAAGDPKGHKQLVAYVVRSGGADDAEPPYRQVPDAFTPTKQAGVLTDPIERLEFKLSQPGLRATKGQPIQLASPAFDETLREAYLARQSYRQFLDEPVPLEQFSDFLACLRQMKLDHVPIPKYRYPSAGSLYPIQTHLYVKPQRVEGVAGGFYYYHPERHQLVALDHYQEPTDPFHIGANQAVFEQAAFTLFLVGELNAIAPIYGERARDFCLLEAGYMSQLLMTEAPQYQLGLCPIGAVEESFIVEALHLGSSQALLHSLVAGRIDPARMAQWPQTPQIEAAASWREALQAHLASKLPEYMAPSFYVALDALPLTANGKVNRKALPAPDMVRRSQKLIAPANEVEHRLSAIMQEVLQIEQVGVTNNFFELGADSIHLTQVMNKLHHFVDKKISITDMFKYPTIRTLAQYLGQTDQDLSAVQQRRTRAQSRRAARQQPRRAGR